MAASVRRIARLAAAVSLKGVGALALWRKTRCDAPGGRHVCVLGLHRVLSQPEMAQTNSHPAIVLSEGTFARLLEYLEERFRVIPLEAFLDGLGNHAEVKPACLITFDDGWKDTYTRAYPLLRKFRMPATVFLATGSLGTTGGFWAERLRKAMRARVAAGDKREGEEEEATDSLVENLKRLPERERCQQLRRLLPGPPLAEEAASVDAMLTWEQAAEMSCGGIEIGAHTVSHPLLTYEEGGAMEREVMTCKLSIEERLGKRVRSFAYPNGDWDERARELVQRAGYDCAFTTRPGWFRAGQDLYSVRRILLDERNLTGPNGKFSPAMADLALTGWR